MKVLLVEDEVMTALADVAWLEEAGFEVIGPYTSAESALADLGDGRPDVAVLDITLGGAMTGGDLAELLAARGVPCVFASAHTKDVLPVIDVPFAYVPKPYSPEILPEVVRAVTSPDESPSQAVGFVLFPRGSRR